MINYPKAEALKEIRRAAKDVGLTFKQSNTRLNGAYLFKLVDRKSGQTVMSNYQFWTAYSDYCSGYLSTYDGNDFKGIRDE